jgi:hypothetical protein
VDHNICFYEKRHFSYNWGKSQKIVIITSTPGWLNVMIQLRSNGIKTFWGEATIDIYGSNHRYLWKQLSRKAPYPLGARLNEWGYARSKWGARGFWPNPSFGRLGVGLKIFQIYLCSWFIYTVQAMSI